MEQETRTTTPEEYAALINRLVCLMVKEKAWERLLSRLYADANRLYCTNSARG